MDTDIIKLVLWILVVSPYALYFATRLAKMKTLIWYRECLNVSFVASFMWWLAFLLFPMLSLAVFPALVLLTPIISPIIGIAIFSYVLYTRLKKYSLTWRQLVIILSFDLLAWWLALWILSYVVDMIV